MAFDRRISAVQSFGLAVTVLAALAGGCGSDHVPFGGQRAQGGLEGGTEKLFAKTSVLWQTNQVPVCWDNPSAVPAEQREWVRDAIHRTWSFAGDVEFTGWGTCTSSSGGVRINLMDDRLGSRVISGALIGNAIAGVQGGLILNHTFQNFQVSPATPNYSFVITCTPTSTAEQLRECIENIAVHEFGHVLGFDHEQNAPTASSQPDFPSNCGLKQLPASGDTLWDNDWDLNSVMNYCSPAYGGRNLSAIDFEGMVGFYGISPRFVAALVAITG